MKSLDEILRCYDICKHSRECGTGNTHGCSYGEDSVADCTDRLNEDLTAVANQYADLLELEHQCAGCPHEAADYCNRNGCVYVNAARLLRAVSEE